jgi:hypothetical protein
MKKGNTMLKERSIKLETWLVMFSVILFTGHIVGVQAVKRGIFRSASQDVSVQPVPAAAPEKNIEATVQEPAKAPKADNSAKTDKNLIKKLDNFDSKKTQDRIEAINAVGNLKAKEYETRLIEKLGK